MFVQQSFLHIFFGIQAILVASLFLPAAKSFQVASQLRRRAPLMTDTRIGRENLAPNAPLHILPVFSTMSPSALYAAADDDNEDNNKKKDKILECTAIDETDRLKRQLFQLGASYDRGYGASQRVRREMLNIVQDLERCNPETNASMGIEGSSSNNNISPLLGPWQMVWTTAVDVLLLQASPILSPGAIYQVFDPPIITNIIDFFPRLQSLFPPDVIPNTLLRAKVQTRANQRKGFPNRVGLVFERVQFQPLQLLGQDVEIFPPLLAIDLPKLPGSLSGSKDSGPGYFDVTYLDDELLVIRQNEPGGLFVLRKVESIEA